MKNAIIYECWVSPIAGVHDGRHYFLDESGQEFQTRPEMPFMPVGYGPNAVSEMIPIQREFNEIKKYL